VAEAFAALAADLGQRPATLAVGWVASHPSVTSVLLGARRLDQLDESLAAADLVLDDAARARIAALTPAPPPATDRSEEHTALGGERRSATIP
jgi:aryl-alcohol dehydrogenase-like predicted oxidoreductase